jgi:hypothetical protein
LEYKMMSPSLTYTPLHIIILTSRSVVAGVKRRIATIFEDSRFHPLLLLVIIGVPFWCLLFPPAVTAGVSWTQVRT